MRRATHNTKIPIDSGYSLIGVGFQELRCDDFFCCEDDAIFTSYADSGTAVFDGFTGIFDLGLKVKIVRNRAIALYFGKGRTWKFRPSGEKMEFSRS